MLIGEWVVIRGKDSGVFFGRLKASVGMQALVENCSTIWDWYGANTVQEIANNGVEEQSNISEPVSLEQINDVIQILLATPKAVANLSRPRWRNS